MHLSCRQCAICAFAAQAVNPLESDSSAPSSPYASSWSCFAPGQVLFIYDLPAGQPGPGMDPRISALREPRYKQLWSTCLGASWSSFATPRHTTLWTSGSTTQRTL